MGNTNINAAPLLSPQQLWAKPNAPKPNAPKPNTVTAPAIPNQIISKPLSLPSTLGQDRVQTSGAVGATGLAAPQVSFAAPPAIPQQAQDLQRLLMSADNTLMSKYNIQISQNGGKSEFRMNGQVVTAAQAQQYLLPHASFLHRDLVALQGQIKQSVDGFYSQVQAQFGQMNAQEQTAVRIQAQAIEVLHENLQSRINLVDQLIK